MKVLITGAAGRLGQAIAVELSSEHVLRLIDEDPVAPTGEVEVVQGSLLEPEIAWQAVREVDAIIHTGEPPASLAVGSEQALLERATRGTHVLLSAAVQAGVMTGLFFLVPLFVSIGFEHFVESAILSNIIEGLVRLLVFLLYIWGIGFIRDISRVFAYHGAEHMTVKAYESGQTLQVTNIRTHSTAHPRCGTAFLLTVMVVAIFTFVWLGRPALPWLIASRLFLIPLIASIAYETIRYSASRQKNPLVRLIVIPNLMLQKLTTREPEDEQIEVAIHAMETVIAADINYESR